MHIRRISASYANELWNVVRPGPADCSATWQGRPCCRPNHFPLNRRRQRRQRPLLSPTHCQQLASPMMQLMPAHYRYVWPLNYSRRSLRSNSMSYSHVLFDFSGPNMALRSFRVFWRALCTKNPFTKNPYNAHKLNQSPVIRFIA